MSQALKCRQCLAHYGGDDLFMLGGFMLCIIFAIIYPENFEESEKMGFTEYYNYVDAVCLIVGFLFLIGSILDMSSCLK